MKPLMKNLVVASGNALHCEYLPGASEKNTHPEALVNGKMETPLP